MSENAQTRRVLIWLLNLLIFVLIPLMLIYGGFSRIEALQIHQRELELAQRIEAELSELARKSNSEIFLVSSFYQAFYSAKEEKRQENIIALHRQLNRCFDYIAWNGNKLSLHTLNPADFNGDWQLALKTIHKLFVTKSEDFRLSSQEEENFKQIFGPQAIPESLKDCRYEDNLLLARPDVSRKKPYVWLGKSKNQTIIIFIKPEILEEKIGLRDHLLNFSSKDIFCGYVDGEKILADRPVAISEKLKQQLREEYSIDKQSFVIDNEVFFQRPINEGLTVFAGYNRSTLVSGTSISPDIAAATFLFFLLPYIVLSFKSIVLNKSLRFSLSLKLGLLFLFSGGLPLSVLFFVAHDYLNQKEFALYDEIHQKATRFLMNFDERYESEYAHRIVIIQNALREYLPSLQKKGIEAETYFPFAAKICKDLRSINDIQIFLIASSSKIVGSERLIYNRGKITRIPGINQKKSDAEESKIYSSIGRFIIDSVNGNPADERVSTEVELLTESALQKNLYELQQEFIAADGKIKLFGLGPRNSPAYVDLISISENRKQDFLLLVYWDDYKLERMYLTRQFLNANRNSEKFRIFACSESSGDYFPDELVNNRKLRSYVENFTQKPNPPRQFIDLDHTRYLIIGFRGKFMKNFCLFALYPAKDVENQIYLQKKMLVSAAIMAVIILTLLGYLLAKSFVLPLQIIATGAEAIRKRDFEMRLPRLGYDEFGDIARVFNETMVDFEELKVAGIVQEQLLPRLPLSTEKISIAGKSEAIGDVGGDYFDFFTVSAARTAMMIGDVSGQGVGAALIMAMAKACVLQSQALLEKPAELLLNLHKLIKETSQKSEKRFMSAQYICFNEDDNCGTFTNAGGFPPLLVDPISRTVKEIAGAGPFLGALKRPRFCEQPFKVEPGQALILYTDGILESFNYREKEEGFDQFRKLVIEAYDIDPEIYCSKILDGCRNLNQSGIVDDKTVVVMLRKTS